MRKFLAGMLLVAAGAYGWFGAPTIASPTDNHHHIILHGGAFYENVQEDSQVSREAMNMANRILNNRGHIFYEDAGNKVFIGASSSDYECNVMVIINTKKHYMRRLTLYCADR